MRILRSGRGKELAALLASGALIAACGGDSAEEQAQSSTWSQAGAPQAVRESNQAPEIRSLRFEPEEARPGRSLRVLVDALDAEGDALDLGYTWTVRGRTVASAGATLQVPEGLRRGDRIEVSVVASDGASSSEGVALETTIENRRPQMSEIRIHTNEGEEGDLGLWVADPVGTDEDGDELSYRFEWYVNGKGPVSEEEELPREGWKRGDRVHLIAWASDGEEESRPLESAPFEISNSPPEIVSRPPPMDPKGRFVYKVEAQDRDGDRGLRYSLVQGPSGMSMDPFSGELRWDVTRRDVGEHLVEIEVDDRKGGSTRQVFYVTVGT